MCYSCGMSRPIMFTCPQTGMNVQHWLADVPEDEKDNHTSVVCLACTQRHSYTTRQASYLARSEPLSAVVSCGTSGHPHPK
jgi:hypothetical protein